MKRKYFAVLLVLILLATGITGAWYVKEKEKKKQESIAGNRLNEVSTKAASIIGNGYLKSEKYDLANDYQVLNVENNKANMIIKVSKQTSPSVTITADGNLLAHIKTELKENKVSNTLSVLVEENIQPTTAIICEIGINSFFRINVKGDGDVKFEGILTGKRESPSKYDLGEMDITHSGSGGMALTIDTVNVKFNAENSYGNVVIKGKIMENFAIFNTVRGGKLDLSELVSPEIDVHGSGLVIVNPQKLLDISLKESGEVLYVKNKSKPLVIRNFKGPYQEGDSK